jgi:hypothetical protein
VGEIDQNRRSDACHKDVAGARTAVGGESAVGSNRIIDFLDENDMR